jgi:hypothetical protein
MLLCCIFALLRLMMLTVTQQNEIEMNEIEIYNTVLNEQSNENAFEYEPPINFKATC